MTVRWGVLGGSSRIFRKSLEPAFEEACHVVVEAPSRVGDSLAAWLLQGLPRAGMGIAGPPDRNFVLLHVCPAAGLDIAVAAAAGTTFNA